MHMFGILQCSVDCPKTMPTYCMVCKKEGVKGSVTIHRFPPLSKPEKWQQWLKALNLKSEDIKSHHYACSRHFRNGDTNNPPSLHLGKRFASPKKMQTGRGLQAQKHQKPSFSPPVVSPTSSQSTSVHSTPVLSDITDDDRIQGYQLATPESEVLCSVAPIWVFTDIPII